jgi:hypothetical protein
MGAVSFVAWLPVQERRMLALLSAGWEQPAGKTLRALLVQAENVRS